MQLIDAERSIAKDVTVICRARRVGVNILSVVFIGAGVVPSTVPFVEVGVGIFSS